MSGVPSTAPVIQQLFLTLLILLSVICCSEQSNWLDNYIIVADSSLDNIYQVNLASHNTRSLQISAGQPLAVAVDSINNNVYWTDVSRKTINKYSLITSNSSVLYADPTGSANYDGIAVDEKRRKIYFTDETNGWISEMSDDGASRRILYENSTSKPRAVVLDSANRELYWSDWSAGHAGIYKSSIVNPRRITLVTGDLRWPNALAIDFSGGVMYWGDAYLHKLESSDLNGNGRRVILQDTSSRYFGLAIDATFLYATDWESPKSIRRINRETFATSVMITQLFFQRLCGIALVESSTPPSTKTTTNTTNAASSSTRENKSTTSFSSHSPSRWFKSTTVGQGNVISTPTTKRSGNQFTSSTSYSSSALPQKVNAPQNGDGEYTPVIIAVVVIVGLIIIIVAAFGCFRFCRIRPSLNSRRDSKAEMPQEMSQPTQFPPNDARYVNVEANENGRNCARENHGYTYENVHDYEEIPEVYANESNMIRRSQIINIDGGSSNQQHANMNDNQSPV